MADKKQATYALFQGNKKVYVGKAGDIEKRAAEHASEGKKFSRVEKTSRLMAPDSASNKESEQLRAYRSGHGGKNPKYNKTEDG